MFHHTGPGVDIYKNLLARSLISLLVYEYVITKWSKHYLKPFQVLKVLISMRYSYCGVNVRISASVANASSAKEFQLRPWSMLKFFVDMSTYAKHFHSMFWKRNIFRTMLGLRYFTRLCNNAEYKNMDQDGSLGQLYNVQIEIKTFYKVTRLGLLIYGPG